MKTQKQINIEIAEEIVRSNGIDASFSGYSDTNGISVYFVTADLKKIRVSDHSVTNTYRLFNEIHLSFPVKKLEPKALIGNRERKKFVLTPEMIEAARLRKMQNQF